MPRSKNKEQLLAAELLPYVVTDQKPKNLGADYSKEIAELKYSSSYNPNPDIASAGSLRKVVRTNFQELFKSEPKQKNASEVIPLVSASDTTQISKPVARSRLGRAYDWATSKGVVRAVNIIVPAIAFAGIGAVSGGMVPAIALGLAGGAMLYNSVRDTRSLRILKELEREHNLLQEYHLAKNVASEANAVLLNKTGIDVARSQSLLSSKLGDHPFQNRYEKNLTTKSLGNTIRDGLFEAGASIATVAVVATSGLANAASNALSVGVGAGVLTVIDIVKSTSERKKMKLVKRDMVRNIRALSADVPTYKNIGELQKFTREQKVNAEALKRLAKDDDVTSLDSKGLIGRSDEYKANLELKEFPEPQKPSFWQRTKQYLKDFNDVHWPNNDYCTAERFASKLDNDRADLVTKYDASSHEIQAHAKAQSREENQIPMSITRVNGKARPGSDRAISI